MTGTVALPDARPCDARRCARAARLTIEDDPMTTPVVSRSLRTFSALALSLGTLAAAAPFAVPSAEAGSLCLKKYSACQIRCAKYGDVGSTRWYACHDRTCAPQYGNCSVLR
jgi:hypothetical protein